MPANITSGASTPQSKNHGQVRMTFESSDEDGFELSEYAVAKKWQGTAADRKDMSQLGRVQQLRRNFQFLSILGFGCTLIATWEVMLTTISSVLTNGGTAGVIWGYIVVVVGFSFVYMSIAEMTSMAPTSGGQYHWVSEFAPQPAQKFLSYLVGWLCFTGWQCAITSITYLAGTVIQGLVILNTPSYIAESWHGTLLVIAVAAFAIIFNTILAKKLPMVEGLLLVLHVLGLFAIIITLWVLAPTANAKDVFTEFTNAGGWNSDGTAFMVGLLSPIISLIGFDCAVHMAEEVKDAGRTLPKAMLWSFGFNSVLGFLMAVTMCFTLGDVDSILNSPTGYPFIQVFYDVTQSYASASILTLIIILTLTSSAIAEIATASRQLWSFARDRGMPGHSWLSHITPGWNIPLNAVLVSLLVTSLLSLINIGSSAALNAILALTTVSLITSYIIVIGCVLLKRVRRQPLPSRRWTLGNFGGIVNVLALCYLLMIYVWMFFPAATPVDPESMNWAIVMFAGIMTIATVWYFVQGHKSYVPPVALVRREDWER
ncbi:Putative amino acid/polyamine transporter I [Septoria linicola]|uniref:Amino acid/polyamine transporter I n=1 Tax=Septoria linicola TaxID=215465 RepID=A0A9Q9EIY2_9PEZI|nr:putative amino acid/polyamine transporter I [Septoria linicola]USW50808.1 Putative amino acid/polyamine transporter I [Septoria linicola]